ncbi:unnamed protein product [Medioppia subpectinata]|uniref:Arrestin C-terminal-like domain-containing protein n=1 Tax=Medioppia subpectinata TaxID=1979941 RepID=A0A7R9KDA7_9ACAR|nr:unnamed protein product [Medioppia subpectinata]CAG2100508.1 unnamed protein product [Medioppia subpectinata]
MKLKTFAVVLDKPDATYRCGEVVSGQCVLVLEGELHLSQLTIALRGEAVCEWTEARQVSERGADGKQRSRQETVRHHGHHQCLDLHYCPGNVYPSLLTSGQHNIGLNFQLPIDGSIPQTLEAKFGRIRYFIESHVKKTQFFAFDEKTKIGIKIISNPLISAQEIALPVMASANKTVGVFGGAPLSLRAECARTAHPIGRAMAITCFVDNRSKKAMTLNATLKEETLFFASGAQKKEEEKIARVSGPIIGAQTLATETLLLPVPVSARVLHNTCPIIRVKHVVDVYLSIAGSFDLHCHLAVVLVNDL